MKIISWNVNGLRAVCKKGFLDWFKSENADVVCLQEIKLNKQQLPGDLIDLDGYCLYFNSAAKKGYSGTAVFTKEKPLKAEMEIGLERFDEEGRIMKIKYPEFLLINIYLPHGGREKENLSYKLNAYSRLLDYLRRIKEEKVILIGDFNIAHQEVDLARPKTNKNNVMFTFEERKQIDDLVALGFIDSFRKFHPEGGNYTWWPYGFNARERNLGWRIDYGLISSALKARVDEAFILSTVKGSDHCPIGIEILIK